MGKKIWFTYWHSTTYVRTYVHPPLHVSQGEILHFEDSDVYIDVDNRERARARDKNKGDQFRWKKNLKIYSGCEKMRNANAAAKKKWTGTHTMISSIKLVTTGGPDVMCVNTLIFTWTKWDESSKPPWTKIVQKSKYNETKLRYL